MSQYPHDFPKGAVGILLDIVTKRELDTPKAVHACYDIVGYALFKKFGESQYELVGDSALPDDHEQQLATFMSEGIGDHIPKWLIELALQWLSKLILK